MKPMAILGVTLVILGVAGLVYEGVTYTTRETVLDIGPLQATAEETKTVPISPIASGAAVVVGLGLLVAGQRQRSK
jgi:hypothetical protein